MKKPERKIVLEIKIDADSWQEAEAVARMASDRITRYGSLSGLVSGGYSYGCIIKVRENPNQTPENYNKEIDEYLKFFMSGGLGLEIRGQKQERPTRNVGPTPSTVGG